MPYYLVRTRGAKGLLLILGVIVVYAGAAMLGILVSASLIALRS
jgi:hypothetical protein